MEKLPAGINITADKTKMQRKILSAYNNVVKEHNQKFPNDLIKIIYVNNVWKIVNSKNYIIYPTYINMKNYSRKP